MGLGRKIECSSEGNGEGMGIVVVVVILGGSGCEGKLGKYCGCCRGLGVSLFCCGYVVWISGVDVVVFV